MNHVPHHEKAKEGKHINSICWSSQHCDWRTKSNDVGQYQVKRTRWLGTRFLFCRALSLNIAVILYNRPLFTWIGFKRFWGLPRKRTVNKLSTKVCCHENEASLPLQAEESSPNRKETKMCTKSYADLIERYRSRSNSWLKMIQCAEWINFDPLRF